MALELDPELDVRICQSGQDALAEASQWRPDIILLDVMMPGMDGETVLSKLREQAETADIPVAFITARKHAQEVARLEELGVKGVLGKPFDPMGLATQIKGLLD